MLTRRRSSILGPVQPEQQPTVSEANELETMAMAGAPPVAKQRRNSRALVAKSGQKSKAKQKKTIEEKDEQEKENASAEDRDPDHAAVSNCNDAESDDLRRSALLRASAQSVELKRLLQSARPGDDDGDGLVGRDTELDTLESFLSGRAGHSVLYVCGPPGSGKTAAVTAAVRQLQHSAGIRCIMHNCMETGESTRAFSARLAELVVGGDSIDTKSGGGGGVGGGPLKLAEASIKHFLDSPKNSSMSLSIVLDEIDQIDAGSLRRIFLWPDSFDTTGSGRLRVLGVANSLALCDRLFPASATVARPASLRQLNFAPYSRAQLLAIVSARLASTPAAAAESADAVRLAAGRVAASTGDARRLLEVCRRSVELADGSPTVKHVGEALRAANASPLTLTPMRPSAAAEASPMSAPAAQAPLLLPLHLRLIAAAALRLRRRGSRQVTIGELESALRDICTARQMPAPLSDDLPSCCQSLHDTGVLRLTAAPEARASRVVLRLDDRGVEDLIADPGLLAEIGARH